MCLRKLINYTFFDNSIRLMYTLQKLAFNLYLCNWFSLYWQCIITFHISNISSDVWDPSNQILDQYTNR
jgi:hypothetical protein